jgi:3D (Asp-Asp-Asp) domain-containing protein
MKNLAGGSGFLGAIALSVSVLFYFQPTVEAATVLANDSQDKLQQPFNNQDNQTVQQLQQPQIQTDNKKSENKNIKPSEASSFRATAYCLKGRTANGGSVRRGIVAADPRVLPLGSRIQINAGSYSGAYTVADTGGAVKGRKLDIWMPSCVEAVRFGRRSITVSRLGRRA